MKIKMANTDVGSVFVVHVHWILVHTNYHFLYRFLNIFFLIFFFSSVLCLASPVVLFVYSRVVSDSCTRHVWRVHETTQIKWRQRSQKYIHGIYTSKCYFNNVNLRRQLLIWGSFGRFCFILTARRLRTRISPFLPILPSPSLPILPYPHSFRKSHSDACGGG